MHTIAATRRGFLYQDRFAVAIYLEHFQSKNIKEYFIDFPLNDQKSIDIRLMDNHNDESIYEVKSGEEFKKDKRRKESSEVRDAFLNLHEYQDLKPPTKLNLYIRKGFVSQIAHYWTCITDTQSHPISHIQAKQGISFLLGKLRIPGISTQQQMYDFCQKVRIADFHDDQVSNGADPFPDIDDFVLQKIDDISVSFGADVFQTEYPSHILMSELYHLCRLHAGTGVDMHSIFLISITEFLTHRTFLDNNYSPVSSGRGVNKQDLRRKLEQDIKDYLSSTAPTSGSTTSIGSGPEGTTV